MADHSQVKIDRLAAGVPLLDEILHGGLPVGSMNIITGGPGVGKSILALQMLFHQARLEKREIYFTSIAEPALKFLRYMQQFEFFEPDLVDKQFFFFDLSDPALSQGLPETVEAIKKRIAAGAPAMIAIDSFKALRGRLSDTAAAQEILYGLAVELAVSQVTSLLVGEYDEGDISHLPEFFAADGIISLSRVTEGLRVSLQLEVLKLRGSGYEPGRHFFEISKSGLTVFPRVSVPAEEEPEQPTERRLSMGIPSLDRMLGGGLPEISSTVIEGSTGAGKTTLALGFLVAGAREGEPGVFFTLDETRAQVIKMAEQRGWEPRRLIEQGLLEIVYISPLNYVADALLQRARELIQHLGAKRIVIDSLTALNLCTAAVGRDQELVYAMVKTFRNMGVTSVLTSEAHRLLGTTELTAHHLSSIADNVIMLRYAEVESRLARAISVLKMRTSHHDDTLRELLITSRGVSVGEAFGQDRGVLTDVPTPEAAGRPRSRQRGKPKGP